MRIAAFPFHEPDGETLRRQSMFFGEAAGPGETAVMRRPASEYAEQIEQNDNGNRHTDNPQQNPAHNDRLSSEFGYRGRDCSRPTRFAAMGAHFRQIAAALSACPPEMGRQQWRTKQRHAFATMQ
jgi:hypothetical protein